METSSSPDQLGNEAPAGESVPSSADQTSAEQKGTRHIDPDTGEVIIDYTKLCENEDCGHKYCNRQRKLRDPENPRYYEGPEPPKPSVPVVYGERAKRLFVAVSEEQRSSYMQVLSRHAVTLAHLFEQLMFENAESASFDESLGLALALQAERQARATIELHERLLRQDAADVHREAERRERYRKQRY